MTPFLTKQELAEQRKRNAAWKSMNESTATVKASDKATKYRLLTDEDLEAYEKEQKQKKELSSKDKVKTEEEQRQNAPKKVTVEWIRPSQEDMPRGDINELYNLNSKGEIVKNPNQPKEKPLIETLAEISTPGFKRMVSDIIDSGELYEMKDDFFGVEYGDRISEKENLDTYEELLGNEEIKNKLRRRALSNYTALHPKEEINDYYIDIMLKDVIGNKIQEEKTEENEALKSYAEQQILAGKYDNVLNLRTNTHIKQVSPEEQFIIKGLVESRKLQKVINNPNIGQEEYAKTFSKLTSLDQTIKDALKKHEDTYSFSFDNITGKRLTKEEEKVRAETGEEGTMTNREKELAKMRVAHKDADLETLERGYFSHLYKYDNYTNKLNKKYDINPSTSYVRKTLYDKGYRFKPNTITFEGVKARDLIPFIGQDTFAKDIEKGIAIAEGKTTGTQVRGLVVPVLEDLQKEKIPLMLEREAYKLSYLMNVDPKSIEKGYTKRFFESISDAAIGEKATREFFETSPRTKLDQIKEVFDDIGFRPTPEQEENFKRDDWMRVTEGAGSFIPEIPKFFLANYLTGGILTATGFGARIAALGRSKKLLDQIKYHGFNMLKEEAVFKMATIGESQTGGGGGFYLGGQLVGKLGKFLPISLTGRAAAFRPFTQKVIQAGPGMAIGSEGATFVESIYNDAKGNKSFKMAMEELYGDSDETKSRMLVNLAVGSLIGTHNLKRNDFKSIAAKRDMVDNLNVEIEKLEAEENPKNKKTIEQKINLMNSLNLELNFADQAFNDLDILSLKKEIKSAKDQIASGKLDSKQTLEAENFIAEGGAKIDAVRRNLIRDFNVKAKDGAFGKDAKLVIVEGEEAMGNSNKAEYKPNGEIWVNIEKFRKGVLGHEVGHAMVKAAFAEKPELAQRMKDAIQPVVEKALQKRKALGGSLEKTIEKFYSAEELKDVKRPEEYIMNVIELLQDPNLRDAMLNTDILPTLRRALGEIGNKIGFDFTSSKDLDVGDKNANVASDLLEFFYELGTSAEGRSSSALKNKFKKFDNILIDGKQLFNKNTGEEIITEGKAIEDIESRASKDLSEGEKKDIFSKATRAYEESIANGDSPEIAGLMVGYEMEPLVRKQVERYLDAKGITMSRDQIQDIVDSLTTDSGQATFGVPNLTEAWTKGQTLIEYIKTENPSREAINSKAKELGIQDRTSAGSDSSTIDKYIKMAKGETEQAQLTSYIFGNLPKRILQTLQKSEFADSFNTFSMEDVKNIDKLEESAGISGASSSSELGYVDISSPEKYTRETQKNAEITLELPTPLVEKINNDANRFLNSQKLENLDAKAVGTVPLKDGGKAKVAMLESDKARITYPDGRVEIIKARSPKLVEQHLGAPDKSFEKGFNFKEGLSEDFKNSLFNDLSKEAGNIIDNKKATPAYEKFIDNAFPLFKTFLSQYSVNKRFAAFKEPYIDPATGKQAREKTAAGNPIFTKKNVTLAEWRKYFLGDGTQRIDGKRRSIIDALAIELGFDATMNVLGKEAMREQVESRQEALSTELIENYVAVIAKQLDRGTPDSMASKIVYEISNRTLKSKEWVTGNLHPILYDKDGNLKPLDEIAKSELGSMYLDMVEGFINKDILKNTLSIKKGLKVNSRLKTKLRQRKVNVSKETLQSYKSILRLNEAELKEYNQFAVDFISTLPKEIISLTTSGDGGVLYSVISELFGYTGRRSSKIKSKAGDEMLYFGRLDFQNVYEGTTPSKEGNVMSEALQKKWEGWVEKVRKNTPEGMLPTVVNKTTQFFKKVEKIQKLDIAREEKIKMVLETPGLKEATVDIQVKSEFLELFLSTIGEKSKNLTKPELEKLSKNVAVLLLNNDGTGIRKFSAENYMDLSLKSSEEIKNEHLKAKATFAADVLEQLLNGTLNEKSAKELTDSYISLIGGKSGQDMADVKFGTTIEGFNYEKMAMAQWFNMGKKGRMEAKEALSNILNIKTGKTAWEELVGKKIVSDIPAATELKDINGAEADIPMASKDLSRDLSDMIERKKGIPAGEELSAAKASIIGRNKGEFKFFVPPNAEDFAGLLYKFYGKGKQGDADMKLMKETLLDPYEKAENALSSYRQKLATDLKAMDKQLNEIGGKVTKESREALKKTGFDSDQATRVYIWNKKGEKIPDITADEITELSNIVSNDARLRAYADGVTGLVDFPAPTDAWYASNLKYDLYKHSTEGVRKDFLAPWKENMDAMFTPENYNRMEAAYGKDFVDNFKQLTNRMETGKARPENIGKIAAKGLDWINGSVGVIMWMNTRSAVLQTISAVNYINWKDNNLFAAGKTLTKPVEFAKTFKELMNSDFLKQRRSGLEINIEDAEIAKAIEKGGNAPERLFGKLIKAGFKPTQIADSFAIAIGGTPFYINRTKTYQKEVIIDKDGNSVRKYTDAEAKQKAFDDFRALSEEHQQSSRQDRVSNVQLGVLGRLVFAFNNTPMQMTRLQKKAALDIINRRGDAKTNVSKLIYYGLVQSAIFYALQQGAFGMLFGKDEDELKEGEAEYLAKKKEDKVVKMANGMIDSFLSGAGMTGKLMVTAKNTLLKYQSESEKGYNASTADVINEGLSLSPPLSSKTKKIASAFKELKYADTKKGKIKAEKTGILNSPNTLAGSKLIAVGTNIPIDRFLNKINNVATVVSDENVEDWQRIALALGWDKYSLGMYEDPYLDPTEQAAADALVKKQASEAAKITRDAKKAEEKATYDALPQATKDSLDFVKIKEKEKKSRDKYIEEEVRKSKLTPEQLEYEKYLAKEKRKQSTEKAKATKRRNQKIKDSINFANTRR